MAKSLRPKLILPQGKEVTRLDFINAQDATGASFDALMALPHLEFVSEKPANSTSPGVRLQAFADLSGLYVCIRRNAWRRLAWDSTWS